MASPQDGHYGLIDLEVREWALPAHLELHLGLMLVSPLLVKTICTLLFFSLAYSTLFDIGDRDSIFIQVDAWRLDLHSDGQFATTPSSFFVLDHRAQTFIGTGI